MTYGEALVSTHLESGFESIADDEDCIFNMEEDGMCSITNEEESPKICIYFYRVCL